MENDGGIYVTNIRIQRAIGLQRQIDHAVAFGYGTDEQHAYAQRMLSDILDSLTPGQRAHYDEVIEFYRDPQEAHDGTSRRVTRRHG